MCGCALLREVTEKANSESRRALQLGSGSFCYAASFTLLMESRWLIVKVLRRAKPSLGAGEDGQGLGAGRACRSPGRGRVMEVR